MKHSTLLAALLAAFAISAQAQSTSTNDAASTSNATSSPTISSGNSSAGSESAATSNPNNQANQQVQLNTYSPEKQTIQQDVHYSGTQTLKNVPGIAMSGPASGPCTGLSGGVGIAGPGFGIGGNMSKVDDGCTVRENTRTLGQVFQSLGSDDPMKAEARAAMLEGMAALRAMTAKIAADYPAPKTTAAAAANASVAAVAPPSSCAGYAGKDPIVKARLGCE